VNVQLEEAGGEYKEWLTVVQSIVDRRTILILGNTPKVKIGSSSGSQ
jgi:hypothetical protein